MNFGDHADSRDVIGSEVWLCGHDTTEDNSKKGEAGSITILSYTDGKCQTLKVRTL